MFLAKFQPYGPSGAEYKIYVYISDRFFILALIKKGTHNNSDAVSQYTA